MQGPVGREAGAGDARIADAFAEERSGIVVEAAGIVTKTLPDETSATRVSAFTYRTDGLLESETIQPHSTVLRLDTVYGYDVFGNITTTTVSGPDIGVTGAGGTVMLESPHKIFGGTFTFTVTNVVKTGYTNNAALNAETADSITAP